MIAHHCGIENADHAKFCKGCGESLAAAMIDPAPAQPLASDALLIEVQSEPEVPPVAPAPELPESILPETKTAGNRLGTMLVIGALAIAAAAGGAWWMMRGKTPAPAVEGDTGAGTTAPVSHATLSSASADAPVVDTPVKKTAPASAQGPSDEEKRLKREAAARNKTELDVQRKESQEQRRQTAEAARQRDADARTRAEEARRSSQQVAQPADRRTIKQICGDRPNAFSRSVCELRECARPAKADSAECVEMRERNNPVTPGFMN